MYKFHVNVYVIRVINSVRLYRFCFIDITLIVLRNCPMISSRGPNSIPPLPPIQFSFPSLPFPSPSSFPTLLLYHLPSYSSISLIHFFSSPGTVLTGCWSGVWVSRLWNFLNIICGFGFCAFWDCSVSAPRTRTLGLNWISKHCQHCNETAWNALPFNTPLVVSFQISK